MDPLVRQGIRKRGEWIRKNPGTAGDYIRLAKADRDKVDQLFVSGKRLKANEVTSLVEKLTEDRLSAKRKGSAQARALANMRARLLVRPYFKDDTVAKNVGRMTAQQARKAAAASVDELLDLARQQYAGNLFYYR